LLVRAAAPLEPLLLERTSGGVALFYKGKKTVSKDEQFIDLSKGIPPEIIFDKRIKSHNDPRVLMTLYRLKSPNSWSVFIKWEALADMSNVSRRSIYYICERLESIGLIKTNKRKRRDEGEGTRFTLVPVQNVYKSIRLRIENSEKFKRLKSNCTRKQMQSRD